MLDWSRTLVGDARVEDNGDGVAVDAHGNVYVIGDSGWSTNSDGNDVFAAKYDAGGELQWITCFGGTWYDYGSDIAIDDDGNVVVTGYTYSNDFTNAINDSVLYDAFVAKLDADAGDVLWSAYLGGGDEDMGNAIAIDGDGNIFVAGETYSSDWETANNASYAEAYNPDAFVAKLDADGTLLWVSYLGGTDEDYGRDVAVDSEGNVVIAGYTYSEDVVQTDNAALGSYDAFVAKLDTDGSIVWANYLGGSDEDYGQGVVIDSEDNIIVAGYTFSDDLAEANNELLDSRDAFAVKLDADGEVLWSTYLGGSDEDGGEGIAIDSGDNVFVTGCTDSDDFVDAGNDYGGDTDAFVAKLDADGSILWATYLGGSGYDLGNRIVAGDGGIVYVTGRTKSSDFEGVNNDYASAGDAFLAKITEGYETTTALKSSAGTVGAGAAVTFTATVSAAQTGLSTPIGVVTFKNGETVLAFVTLDSNGVAIYTTSSLTVGTHTITAVYSGSSEFTGSRVSITQVVGKATTTTLTSSLANSTYSQVIKLTAIVKATETTKTKVTGTVTFYDGDTVLGRVAVSGNGKKVTLVLPTLSAGTHTIKAVYSGDGTFVTSSISLTQTVSVAVTTTKLKSSPSKTVVGQSCTLTATVASVKPAKLKPTGAVSFYDGSTFLGSATVDSKGKCTLTVSTLTVGTHSLRAVYEGTSNFAGSEINVSRVVVQAKTTTSLSVSTLSPKVGQSVVLTAAISIMSPGAGSIGGTVTFWDGTTKLGTVSVDATGKSQLTVSTLAVGKHKIGAVYSGDSSFRRARARMHRSP